MLTRIYVRNNHVIPAELMPRIMYIRTYMYGVLYEETPSFPTDISTRNHLFNLMLHRTYFVVITVVTHTLHTSQCVL